MVYKLFKYLICIVVLFHCLGATQLVSAYSKDSSAFVGMINMAEEETKKEKESKEDADYTYDIRIKNSLLICLVSFIHERIYFFDSMSIVAHQFVIELTTPPPDYLV